jgi:hypothetical protein
MALCMAPFLGALALFLALLCVFMPVTQPALIAMVLGTALVVGGFAVWMVKVALGTRRCRATLTAEHLDLTSFQLVRGRGTRRVANARIAWADVQSLAMESYDLVGGGGWRMELRNLFIFSRQGDFALYGIAWKDWDALVASIVQRSGREPGATAPERAADIAELERRVRRNYRVLRVICWIGLLLLALMLLACVAAGFSSGSPERWVWVALLIAPVLGALRMWKR